MKAAALLPLVFMAFLLCGCATAGPLKFNCDGFPGFVEPVQPSKIVQEIQSDTVTSIRLAERESQGAAIAAASSSTGSSPAAASPSLGAAMERLSLAAAANRGAQGFAPGGEPAVLLLSGGGQWGAFGAGFLDTFHRQGRMPADFRVITGISTGGMQSLFLASDPAYPEAWTSLIANYSPRMESEIVDRHSQKWMAGITGSLAGLKPLRRRVEAALCEKGDPALGCPMIDGLAKSGREAFIGFVKADSGELQYAAAAAIARTGSGGASLEQRRNAQQCLTAIALASAAMPVFFQQVRINGVTYYDGGVRQSVFETNVAETVEAAVNTARAAAPRLNIAPESVQAPPLYVVRNGPTQLLGPDGKPNSLQTEVDTKADALTNAFRAEAIVVNQLEVGSIAALRIAHPTGPISLVTADGFNRFVWAGPDGVTYTGCPKPQDVMFDPRFMRCLQSFGASKAERPSPWITISPLDLAQTAARAESASSGKTRP